jgi:hypothetical protein
MDTVYNEVKKYYNDDSNIHIQFKKQSLESSIKSKVTDELLHSKYIALPNVELKKILETTRDFYEWSSDHFSISVWALASVKKEHWDAIMRRVLKRLETLCRYYKHDLQGDKIKFTCVPLDAKRELPVSSKMCVKSQHINGGFTFIGLKEVYIFRKEECPKVMLHEYIHQIQGNQDRQWNGTLLKALYEKWNISTEGCMDIDMLTCNTSIRPNEAIVEFWAWIHQIQFISLEYDIPWVVLWNAEYNFVMGQILKLIRHQKECHPTAWLEETHAFSYHVLKGFFAWCLYTEQQFPVRITYNAQEVFEKINQQWSNYWSVLQSNTYAISKGPSLRMTLLGDF